MNFEIYFNQNRKIKENFHSPERQQSPDVMVVNWAESVTVPSPI